MRLLPISLVCCLLLAGGLAGCGADDDILKKTAGRTIVLGFDGMDPRLAQGWMSAGELPNFSALAERGSFMPLATTVPAQSPVAWASFATGTGPGAHGIYDFLRRDSKTYLPSFSVSETLFPDTSLELFGWKLPLSDATIRNRRVGVPFWSQVEAQGGSATVQRVPVTFPPDEIDHMVSGMGVPDLLGTQGTYTLYSTRQIAGGQSGRVVLMKANTDGSIDTQLQGPAHPLKPTAAPLSVPLRFYPTEKGMGVVLGESEFVLREGSWSGWVPVSFNLLGVINIRGVVRLHLLQGYPRPRVYVSPIQIDPQSPVVPISSPDGYAKELADRIGMFHTIGMPEETWSLNNGHLTDDGFLSMIKTTFAEREAMLFDALENNDSSLIVSVFVQTDRVSHMFYRGLDDEHALHDKTDATGKDAIAWSYREADRVLGKVMKSLAAGDRLIVISDHGFSPYRWSVHLNKWLVDNGYMVLKAGASQSDIGFSEVDWPATRAYAVGLNSVYLNLSGREAQGAVRAQDAARLKNEISRKLLAMTDSERQQSIVKTVYDGAAIYPGNANEDAPDLVVGYQRGYRASWQTTLGAVPEQLVEVNRNKWSGDHCISVDEVPGVLFTSWPLQHSSMSIDQIGSLVLGDSGSAPKGAR